MLRFIALFTLLMSAAVCTLVQIFPPPKPDNKFHRVSYFSGHAPDPERMWVTKHVHLDRSTGCITFEPVGSPGFPVRLRDGYVDEVIEWNQD